MKIKHKKITFYSNNTGLDILRPTPSSKSVPSWFRTMPGVSEDKVMTIKKCVPFLDSLTIGYQILLPANIEWSNKSNSFISHSHIPLNSDHVKSQTEGLVIPEEYDPQPHKWLNSWHIKTPKGYSCLFIHPMNRLDLPFMSFGGVVDTDKHPMVINFPFVLKKEFEGIIPAGTPIIQIIPFKRDSWNSHIIDQGESHRYPYEYKVQEPPFGFYKRNFWSRKTFT